MVGPAIHLFGQAAEHLLTIPPGAGNDPLFDKIENFLNLGLYITSGLLEASRTSGRLSHAR